jgi:membrane protease YdiL (CAAX protease family)
MDIDEPGLVGVTEPTLSRSLARRFLVWGLLLELPIRYMIFPDPWLHGVDHWYFSQPLRLLLEIGFVALALVPFLWTSELRGLVSLKLDRKQALYLAGGLPIGIAVFLSTEWSELQVINASALWSHVPLWFVTGMFIGVGQELTFRGLILTGLESIRSRRIAVAGSTLLFVLGPLHGPRMYAYAMGGFVTEAVALLAVFTAVGLLFAWIRIRTGHVLVPALLHGVGNAVTWGSVFVVKLFG